MKEEPTNTRRSFIASTTATIGGLAITGNVSSKEPEKRFIINSAKSYNTSNLDIIHRLDPINFIIVRGTETMVEKASAEYAPDFVSSLDLPVEPMKPPQQESATDEPLYNAQWDKQTQNIPAAHNITRGEGSRVAVIDTGIDPNHPDLQHALNKDLSRNITEDSGDYTDVDYHGTHVSGIIAANDQNQQGIVGSAPGTDLVALRVFEEFTGAPFGDVLAAILYSVEIGADVANLSLGVIGVRNEFGSFYGKALNKTMTYANKEGTLLIISSGNSGLNLQNDSGFISLPSEGAQGCAVSATGPVKFDQKTGQSKQPAYTPSSYSNYGTNVIDIAAPGGRFDSTLEDQIISTVPTTISSFNSYAYLAGTSMAAPQVAGAAALIASTTNYPSSTQANKIESDLKDAASVPEEYNMERYGAGFLDILSALKS